MDKPSCKICQNTFNTSTYLPLVMPMCGHTFCRSCIYNLYAQNLSKKLVCPEDNIDQGRLKKVDDLKQNSLIMKMIVVQGKEQKRCHEHNKPNEFNCLDCEKEVCSMCGLFGIHKNHKITTKAELRTFNNNIIGTNIKWMEKLFNGQKMDKYHSYADLIQNEANSILEESKQRIASVFNVS